MNYENLYIKFTYIHDNLLDLEVTNCLLKTSNLKFVPQISSLPFQLIFLLSTLYSFYCGVSKFISPNGFLLKTIKATRIHVQLCPVELDLYSLVMLQKLGQNTFIYKPVNT